MVTLFTYFYFDRKILELPSTSVLCILTFFFLEMRFGSNKGGSFHPERGGLVPSPYDSGGGGLGALSAGLIRDGPFETGALLMG